MSSRDVEFLLVGAYALAIYLEPRATQDLDVWIRQTEANVEKLRLAMSDFGIPISAENAADFLKGRKMIQIGVEPNKVDILSFLGPTGGEFEFQEVFERSIETDYFLVPVRVPSASDLLAAKVAANRPKDQGDIAQLREFLIKDQET